MRAWGTPRRADVASDEGGGTARTFDSAHAGVELAREGGVPHIWRKFSRGQGGRGRKYGMRP